MLTSSGGAPRQRAAARGPGHRGAVEQTAEAVGTPGGAPGRGRGRSVGSTRPRDHRAPRDGPAPPTRHPGGGGQCHEPEGGGAWCSNGAATGSRRPPRAEPPSNWPVQPDVRRHPHGRADARHGRIRGDGGYSCPRARDRRVHADRRAHRPHDGGRSRALPGGRHERVRVEAAEARDAAGGHRRCPHARVRAGRRAGSRRARGARVTSPAGRIHGGTRARRGQTARRILATTAVCWARPSTCFWPMFPQQLAAIAAAVVAGDAAATARAAHALKGAVGLFSTGPAYTAAQQLEEHARGGLVADLEARRRIVERAVTDLVDALGTLRQSLGQA